MIPIKTDSAWRGTSDSRNCGIRDMVLFADLNEQDFGLTHAPIDDLEYSAGAGLYTAGSRARGIITLRKGLLKLVRVTADGRQRIVRVLRPGDVAGLEALVTSQYDSAAQALTDLLVCRIPLDVIHALGAQSPRLDLRLMQKWQNALKEADGWLADLNFGTARHRVSNLVLKMRKPDDDSLVTLLGREDMGAMLDLTFETVSREISALVRQKVLVPQDRQGRLYSISQLEALQNC
jgi:CRP/FNR family transcriptional regulator, anaerobic regulatory protein